MRRIRRPPMTCFDFLTKEGHELELAELVQKGPREFFKGKSDSYVDAYIRSLANRVLQHIESDKAKALNLRAGVSPDIALAAAQAKDAVAWWFVEGGCELPRRERLAAAKKYLTQCRLGHVVPDRTLSRWLAELAKATWRTGSNATWR